MAYRFLLEVPETLADQAGIAVGAAGDAQVVVRRAKSHGLAYDDPYIDMTVAAHSLSVVPSLYRWYDEFRPTTPEIGIVLHSGERLSLKDHNRETLVAAIRRDQPWVERTAPKIGDHEEDYATLSPISTSRAGVAMMEQGAAILEAPVRAVNIQALNHIGLRVTNLDKAEAFYTSFFAMDVLGRGRVSGEAVEALPDDFSWEIAGERGADVSYLQNGPLQLALHRLGLGARIERSLLDHISLRVDATTYTRLKGQALMRGYEIVAEAETAFSFRDPYSVVWEFDLAGNPVFGDAK